MQAGWLQLRVALFLVLALSAGVAYAHQGAGGKSEAAAAQPAPSPRLVAQGQALFQKYCATCHAPRDGKRDEAPSLAGLYQRKLTPAMKHPVNDANIGGHIKQGGPVMPPFPWLGKEEIAALLAYLKTL
ncbi:c-type cytochrome [Desulfoferula mesophila]|uniref:Cytochrome c domain-containing protein n=1 Tax=Desulfoferula mesophila TaxID=3058419 RepID=A0AAU9EWR9_9BACT|nr:hypothetical protein FAK_12240 [Desulfoferula mesophilus]